MKVIWREDEEGKWREGEKVTRPSCLPAPPSEEGRRRKSEFLGSARGELGRARRHEEGEKGGERRKDVLIRGEGPKSEGSRRKRRDENC